VNHRLVTPVIVLASFAGSFGLMSWRAGLWPAAPATAAVTLPIRAARASASIAPAAQETTAAPAPRPPAAAPPETVPEAVPVVVPVVVPVAVPTDEFLAAQDRAAAHSSRSH
jgi:hypothetical protein